MKKLIPVFILVSVITAYSINIAYAGFGGGNRPGTFGTGGFSTTTVNTLLTYNELTELAIDINSRIINGDFNNVPPFSNHPGNYAVTVDVYNSSESPKRYVLFVTYSSTKYYFKNNSGGLYYAYADTDNPAVSKPILDKLELIRSQLVTANNTLTSISSKITNYIVTNIDDIESSFSTLNSTANSINSTVNSIYSRLAYTDPNGITGSVASYLYNIQNRLQFRLDSSTAYTASDLLYNIWQRLTFTDDNVTHSNASLTYNVWQRAEDINSKLSTVNTVLSQIKGNTDEDIYVTIYTTDSSGNSYSTVSYRPEIIDGIISYLNTNHMNKPLKVLYRDGQDGQVADVVRNFMFADVYNGYIRIRVMWGSNSVGYVYLSSPNHVLIKQNNTYIDDTTFLNTIVSAIENVTLDDDNIVDAIDRIYNWLDNADLATNETIIQVVQDYSNDVDNSVDWASKILDLFRDVFVFDRPAPSFTGILSYFYSLGRDAE